MCGCGGGGGGGGGGVGVGACVSVNAWEMARVSLTVKSLSFSLSVWCFNLAPGAIFNQSCIMTHLDVELKLECQAKGNLAQTAHNFLNWNTFGFL